MDDDDFNGCVDLDMWDSINESMDKKVKSVSVGSTLANSLTGMRYVNAPVPVPAPLILDETNTVRIKGNLVISDVDGNNKVDVSEFLQTMQERLCILQANFEAMEEYPALKDAYEQYKMLEKLLMESSKKD